jgi:hypothetical protein
MQSGPRTSGLPFQEYPEFDDLQLFTTRYSYTEDFENRLSREHSHFVSRPVPETTLSHIRIGCKLLF